MHLVTRVPHNNRALAFPSDLVKLTRYAFFERAIAPVAVAEPAAARVSCAGGKRGVRGAGAGGGVARGAGIA